MTFKEVTLTLNEINQLIEYLQSYRSRGRMMNIFPEFVENTDENGTDKIYLNFNHDPTNDKKNPRPIFYAFEVKNDL